MGAVLESAGDDESSRTRTLWRARGEDLSIHRPLMTGDVLRDVDLTLVGAKKATKPRTVIVLAHPCAVRTDGVTLAERILVAVVRDRDVSQNGWPVDTHFSLMPLPGWKADGAPGTAAFDELAIASPAALGLDHRVAAMEVSGISLLMQRLVHHQTRVVVETAKFAQAFAGAFEEIDLAEEWVTEATAAGAEASTAEHDFQDWIRAEEAGHRRQDALADERFRAGIRRAARQEVRQRYR